MPSKVGEYLLDQMERRGWRQVDLARQAGLTPSTLNGIIHKDNRIPDAPTVDKLAQALGRPPAEIYAAAGYPAGAVTVDAKTQERLLAYVAANPWLMPALEKMMELSGENQETLLAQLDFLAEREGRKDRRRR